VSPTPDSPGTLADAIPLAEFQERRRRVLEALGDSVGVVFAGDGAPPLRGRWTPDWSFYYLTGIKDEQGAAVLFDPTADDPRRRCVLFLRPLNPELEAWDGYREKISQALKSQHGFETVLRTTYFARTVGTALRKAKKASLLHPVALPESPVQADLALFRKAGERMVGLSIEDRVDLLPSMRAVKSERELALMQRAADATALGYAAVLKMLRPGVRERDVQRALEDGFASGGAEETAYNSIVGSGLNATVLHYNANTGACAEGELLVIDAGASFRGYACDVTRTYPVSGRFTPEQRELYTVVLRAQEAAIAAAKPGAFMHEVDRAARDVIARAGLEDFYIHGIGHQLGLEVHDITPDGPLREGMVITIEPGVYLPEKKMGCRIEDDIVVRASGPVNLTRAIAKDPDEIERLMGARG
jgi:Xaa-Pro aminopeptidase